MPAGPDGEREALAALFGPNALVVDRRPIGGGCISAAQVLTLSGGERVFLKGNSARIDGLFRREAEGLSALAAAKGLRVPRVLALRSEATSQLILLEYIKAGAKGADFWETFGSGLAELHRASSPKGFGFESDNYLGSTEQKNAWCSDWIEFFGDRRLRFQAELAVRRGGADRSLAEGVEAVIRRLPELLDRPSRSSLLHGDLWSGNFMADERGNPVLIDPAVYYGHREADLAMSELFGGFDARFYAAYRAAWPLEPGYRERRDLYNLYHLLNHLNLFGRGYLPQITEIVRRFGG